MVYRNENFDVIKQTNYVLALPFYRNLSKVCLTKPEKVYDTTYGEHFKWVGGQCGYIDENFNVIEPIVHAFEDTPRPKGGKYDGDEPNGFEAKLVAFLAEQIEGGDTIEAVFMQGECNLTGEHIRHYCIKQFPQLPVELHKDNHYVREIHLRLEDQSYFRGLIVSYGGPRSYEADPIIYWHSLEAMEAPKD